MAKTTTTFIRNMAAGEIADDTREAYRVASDVDVLTAVDAWAQYQEYLADIPAWEAKHPSENPPIAEFAEVSDRENVTMPEKIFVECRFWAEDQDGSLEKVKASWCQVNSVNTPSLSPSFLADLGKVFSSRRSSIGQNPV